MKNLDLNNYGVQEMNAEEMNNANGGQNDRPMGKPDYDSSTPAGSGSDKVLDALIIILAGLLTLQKN